MIAPYHETSTVLVNTETFVHKIYLTLHHVISSRGKSCGPVIRFNICNNEFVNENP